MNQDFALIATPANARRLMLLHRVCKLALPDDITTLADQNRLAHDAFDPWVCPFDPAKYQIAQFLLDGNLRGIVQADYHPEIDPLTMLNIVRWGKPDQIAIISDRRQTWSNAVTALALTAVRISTSTAALAEIDRHTAVIYDANYSISMSVSGTLYNLVREFPRFIVFDDRRGFDRLMHWTLWARLLFPTMPHPLYPRLVADVPAGWEKLPLAAFAVMFNTCIFPHLITRSSIVTALQDDYVAFRLKQQGSLMTLT